jgi:hypothetical protein
MSRFFSAQYVDLVARDLKRTLNFLILKALFFEISLARSMSTGFINTPFC